MIPARGGSKRIPRKNIKNFFGKPMIAWAIDNARKSMLFDYIMVSTDDVEIADVSKDFGAEIPFLRPASLSNDHATTRPVIQHAVEYLLEQGHHVQDVCCIYPCTPLLQPSDLVISHSILESSPGYFVYPVVAYSHPIQRALVMNPDGSLRFMEPDYELSRTQDLEVTFHDAGQFYWGARDTWLSDLTIHSNAKGYEVASSRFVDIDSEDDWRRAEFTFQYINGEGRA